MSLGHLAPWFTAYRPAGVSDARRLSLELSGRREAVIVPIESLVRIDSIEIRHVAMPLLHPWKTASHEASAIHAIFARLESDGVYAVG